MDMGETISTLLFQPPPPTKLKKNKVIWLNTSLGSRIPAFFIQGVGVDNPKSLSSNEFSSLNTSEGVTILYSHANAEDLGSIYPWCKYLSKVLAVNILAYDYTGYGMAFEEGDPSEEHCYSDIDAAYEYLRTQLRIPAKNIVLYGRSLGSGPSCYLASRTADNREDEPVGGLILHAPFLSVFRIILDSGCTLPGDKFPNVDFAPMVKSPVLVIHGTHDKIVPFSHSERLMNAFQKQYRTEPLFVQGMGHNNVHKLVRETFARKTFRFLQLYVTSHSKKHRRSHKRQQNSVEVHKYITKSIGQPKEKSKEVDCDKVKSQPQPQPPTPDQRDSQSNRDETDDKSPVRNVRSRSHSRSPSKCSRSAQADTVTPTQDSDRANGESKTNSTKSKSDPRRKSLTKSTTTTSTPKKTVKKRTSDGEPQKESSTRKESSSPKKSVPSNREQRTTVSRRRSYANAKETPATPMPRSKSTGTGMKKNASTVNLKKNNRPHRSQSASTRHAHNRVEAKKKETKELEKRRNEKEMDEDDISLSSSTSSESNNSLTVDDSRSSNPRKVETGSYVIRPDSHLYLPMDRGEWM